MNNGELLNKYRAARARCVDQLHETNDDIEVAALTAVQEVIDDAIQKIENRNAMSYQNAITQIINEHCDGCDMAGPEYCAKSLSESDCKYLWAIEALSRQVPHICNYNNSIHHCPNCGYVVIEGEKYCTTCGQHLDWTSIPVDLVEEWGL